MARFIRNKFAFGILGLTLAIVPLTDTVSAQTADDRTGTTDRSATDPTMATTRTDRDDRGFNPGWLGLIGLAGLAGLLPRKTHAVATHRTGETQVR